MFGPPVPPSDGARFDRPIGAVEFHHRRLERFRANFSSVEPVSLIKVLIPRSLGDRDERFANGRLEAGGGSDSDGDKVRRPRLPTPVARANSHKPAEA